MVLSGFAIFFVILSNFLCEAEIKYKFVGYVEILTVISLKNALFCLRKIAKKTIIKT